MINKELNLAHNFVNQTHRNIFLTGKAGTGKTTFLHDVKQNTNKRLVIVAPTGVAAINAGGVTIHSFFQMPFGPLVPGYSGFDLNKQKFNKQKINLIKTLDLLIIDEISMVRADLLDAIDRILRRYKHYNKPFGGVQVLMIGDIQQLAPVIKPEESALLSQYYNTPYFFSGKVYQEAEVLSVELKKVYRQQNVKFLELLEDIRHNHINTNTLELLNARYQPDFEPNEDEHYITLTTHNSTANSINLKQLNRLKHKSFKFNAKIQGDFPEQAYPTDKTIVLKKGAQVMFIKNDTSVEKHYYNGKIGTITTLTQSHIEVYCPSDGGVIEVTPESWDNTRYTLDKSSNEITEEHIGKFTQIPLRLAWAITIHKSQGLTFDRAIIDASDSFAHGQTYVALSRCKTLEGIVLRSLLTEQSVISDQRVKSFTEEEAKNSPDESTLIQAQRDYHLDLIAELFDYYPLLKSLEVVLHLIYKHQQVIQGNAKSTLSTIKEKVIELVKISHNFALQLKNMTKQGILPENDTAVQERFKKALQFYKTFFYENIFQVSTNLTFDSGNKEVKEDIEKHLKELDSFINQKNYIYKHLDCSFNADNYMSLRAKAQLQGQQNLKIKIDRTDYSEHPELFKELRSYRFEQSDIEQIEVYQVFTQQSLYEICDKLPVTLNQLKKIKGMGKVRINKYGQDIVDIVHEYCEQNQITPNLVNNLEASEKQLSEKGETYKITKDLVKKGYSITEIAQKRSLAEGTIEGHITKLIGEGRLVLEDVFTDRRYQALKDFIKNTKYDGLNELRKLVSEEYSFGELRIVQSAVLYENRNS